MIVRDEARFLRGCLASVGDLVDDLVIVDTGSSDGTVSIARSFGARVVRFPWVDDFSAARNAAVPHARGTWILILDADERLAPCAGPTILAACAAARADAFMLPLHNAGCVSATCAEVLAGTRRSGGITSLPRLLRRTPDLRWEGLIHESPRTWLAAPGRVIRPLDAPIVHYGYADEVVERRDKVRRNRALLRARCDAEPDRPDSRIYLGKGLLGEGRRDEARELLVEAWGLTRTLPHAEIHRPIIDLMAATLLRILCGKPALLSRPYLDDVEAWGLSHPNVMYQCGVAYERLAASPHGRDDALDRARTAYERGLAWSGPPLWALVPGMQTRLLPLRLGIVHTKRGDPQRALQILQPALDAHGDDASLRVAVAEALNAIGRPVDALVLLEPVLEAGAADAWWVGAHALARLGDQDACRTFVNRATALGPTGELHRQMGA